MADHVITGWVKREFSASLPRADRRNPAVQNHRWRAPPLTEVVLPYHRIHRRRPRRTVCFGVEERRAAVLPLRVLPERTRQDGLVVRGLIASRKCSGLAERGAHKLQVRRSYLQSEKDDSARILQLFLDRPRRAATTRPIACSYISR